MKAVPNKLGAKPKQLAFLGGLVLLLIVVYLYNRTPSTPGPPPSSQVQRATATPTTPNPLGPRTASSSPMPAQRTAGRGGVTRSVEDFRPTIKLKEGTDLSRIDPRIRLDLLEKLQKVAMDAGSRSIFELSAPPPPPVKPIVVGPKVVAAATPPPTETGPPKPPPPAPPPPIPLKFYGYANTQKGGPKRAFFLDGEDIFVAAENEMVRNRYKIVRIGLNSAVVEDTTNKNQQTLPLEAELAG